MKFAALIERGATGLSEIGVSSARLDAEVLLARAAGMERSGLLARLRDEVAEEVDARFRELIDRRMGREPVAYILGEKEFFSLMFEVTRDVLIPRPETELLVEETLKRAPRDGRVLDVGTGSGCIAIAIAVNRRDLEVAACDVSTAALAVAARNAERHGVGERTRLVESDLFDQLGDQRFDAIVSNPPYVADLAALEAELDFEPAGALRAGPDGMAVIERLLFEARPRLNPGGVMIVEFGSAQAALVRSVAQDAGFSNVEIVPDLAGLPRMLRAS